MEPPQISVKGVELEVLKTLWDHGPATVRDVLNVLQGMGRDYAYTTVLTMLQRLEGKGLVTSDKSKSAHVFTAAVSREQLLSRRLRDLADQFCDGTASPLLHALVEGGQFSAEDLEHFRRLLDRLDPSRKPRPRTK